MARSRFLLPFVLVCAGCYGQVTVRGTHAGVQAGGAGLGLAAALFGAMAEAASESDTDAKVVTTSDAGVYVVEDTSGGAVIVPPSAGGRSDAVADPSSSSTSTSGGSGSEGASLTTSTAGASGGAAIVSGEAAEVDLYAHATLTGRGRSLGALTGEGVTIRGHVTGLGELTPLADASYATTVGVGGSEASGVIVHTNVVRDASGAPQLVVHVHGAAAGGAGASARLRFHIVLDRSASMSSQWDRTVAAVADIVRALPPTAELQIVAYDDQATTVFGPARVTDASAVIAALAHVEPTGGSNVEAGLRAAYAVALPDGGSHVVLVSDGVPDGGASTAAEFDAIVGGARAHGGCTTSVVAIGANVDARVLRAVAGAGDGAFVLASSVSQLGAAFARDLRAHTAVAASDLDVHVQLGAGVRFGIAAGDAAGTTDFHFAVPRLAPGEDKTFILPLDGRSTAANAVQVHVGWKVGVSSRVASADAALSLHADDAAAATLALLDAQLGAALRASGQAIVDGNTTSATIALRAYAHAAAAVPTTDARVAARTDAVTRIADAIAATGPSASWSDRRLTGNAMLALAWRFGE